MRGAQATLHLQELRDALREVEDAMEPPPAAPSAVGYAQTGTRCSAKHSSTAGDATAGLR